MQKILKLMKSITPDIMVGLGIFSLVKGASIVHAAAGYLVLGICLIASVWFISRGGGVD